MNKPVHVFGGGHKREATKKELGGKGFALAEMSALELPVPPGFTVTTDVCREFLADGQLPDSVLKDIDQALAEVSELCEQNFGAQEQPLLLSVRSGAPISMPGMMDTILNVGLNDDTVAALAKETSDESFAYDCYRRLVSMYGEVVMGISRKDSPFEDMVADALASEGKEKCSQLSPATLKTLVTNFKIEILRIVEKPFPEAPLDQLRGAIETVFQSWNTPRAKSYRAMNGISDTLYTAVNVQQMVFGNRGANSGTGVAFSRNPSTGKAGIYGEYLDSAQGEDVVAGIRTPQSLDAMESHVPEAFASLKEIATQLETHFGDMQDIEFTVEDGKLWILQARNGKRTGAAMLQIAVDLVEEGLLDERGALLSLEAEKISELLHPQLDPDIDQEPIASGLPASPGASIGVVAFDTESAQEAAKAGKTPILIRRDTSPEDIDGMKAAAAIVTERGGMTSHAAVVARGMGKPAITACRGMTVTATSATIGDVTLSNGDIVTVDGSKGRLFLGRLPLVSAAPSDAMTKVMTWVDEFRRLKVRANADTAADVKCALSFGAEGVGLCRTEHMFFEASRLAILRKLILGVGDRQENLEALVSFQRKDMLAIFKEVAGKPVTIRLLDPPLHEFLPRDDSERDEVAAQLGVSSEQLDQALEHLSESNPMLGHRGCRLGLTSPDIYRAQVDAAVLAACDASTDEAPSRLEIMVPFVSVEQEIAVLGKSIRERVAELLEEQGVTLKVPVGTMIELPRACLLADRLAAHADFFSFGTNDLTQTTFGYSRDDVGKFLPTYMEQGIVTVDPFVSLDRSGVGQLIAIAMEKGRNTKTKLKIGLCGEHGGDPPSVDFCHSEGLDYISCSPFRVPIAKLAAAQAYLKGETRKVRQP